MSNYRFLALLFVVCSALFILFSGKTHTHERKDGKILWKLPLVDPEQAPKDINPLVMEGQKIMLETRQHLPEYAGDWISCTNCHFSGGNTLGGKNGGISLVGVTQQYPRKLDDGSMLSIEERINGCFLRSMNGKKLPVDSREMKAMVAFLNWISKPAADYPTSPWLGLPELKSSHVPDPENGAKVFALHCSGCHGANGQGEIRENDLGYPPLWGVNSFNSSAGMHKLPIIASFVYYNMPYQDPFLTVEEALDVASFVIKQPRPKLKK